LGEGDKPGVTCFFPQKNNVDANGNEQSLMIKVAYARRNILFPGDCSATLLEKLSKTQGFADFF
jgi:beta-lactamase superfamily II metal-dependent hydrolase